MDLTRRTGDESAKSTDLKDLSDYARVKLELANIVRFAAERVPRESGFRPRAYTDYFARLADDRFNVALIGRFNRGKTSLMNAMLGSDRLPTGLVPLTSVITSVSYASAECVHVEFERRGLPIEIRMEELDQYITEKGNPGNRRGIREARIQLPAEILRRGYYFVDTPGLGSAIRENTRTSMQFLPETDALVLVSGYDSPLSEEEVRVLDAMARARTRVFLVLNKQDNVSPAAREEVLAYVKQRLETLFSDRPPAVFSTSATLALTAKLGRNLEALPATGLPALEAALIDFLVAHKSAEFLRRMIRRARELLEPLGKDAAVEALRARLSRLESPHEQPPAERVFMGTEAPVQRCELCERIHDQFFEFLCHFQHAVVTDAQELERFTAARGFCPRHLWLYAAVAAPRDICVALAPLLKIYSAELREHKLVGDPPSSMASCQLCAIQRRLEAEVIAHIAAEPLTSDFTLSGAPSLCIPHLRLVTQAIDDPGRTRALYTEHARSFARLAEDMEHHALKHDALRRYLTSEEERRADEDALHRIAGRRFINQ